MDCEAVGSVAQTSSRRHAADLRMPVLDGVGAVVEIREKDLPRESCS